MKAYELPYISCMTVCDKHFTCSYRITQFACIYALSVYACKSITLHYFVFSCIANARIDKLSPNSFNRRQRNLCAELVKRMDLWMRFSWRISLFVHILSVHPLPFVAVNNPISIHAYDLISNYCCKYIYKWTNTNAKMFSSHQTQATLVWNWKFFRNIVGQLLMLQSINRCLFFSYSIASTITNNNKFQFNFECNAISSVCLLFEYIV